MHLMYLLALTYVIYSHSIKKTISWFFVFVVSGSCGMSSVCLRSLGRIWHVPKRILHSKICPHLLLGMHILCINSKAFGVQRYDSRMPVSHFCPFTRECMKPPNQMELSRKTNTEPKIICQHFKVLVANSIFAPMRLHEGNAFFRMTLPQQSIPACTVLILVSVYVWWKRFFQCII